MLFKRECKTIEFLGAMVPAPTMLLDFLGFEKHLVQIRDKRGAQIWPGWYEHAAYYICDLPADKVYGTGQEVTIPDFVKAPDYEFELACFVGKEALISSEKEALEFFKEDCYLTIMNDWSARDVQKKDMDGLGPAHSKSILGKSFGPKLVKASDFDMDENGVLNCSMILQVNGDERCNSNYNSLYHQHPETGKKQAWSFPRIIAWLGQNNISMQPGYVLGSGTVGNGCIAEFSAKIDPKSGETLVPAKFGWLQDSDIVSMQVEGIGTLENKVRIPSLAKTR